MKYCTRCLQPDTRPAIFFSEEGVCGACLWEDEKKIVDWESREAELREMVETIKANNTGPYDCAVGVSGGKDSTFQAIYARDVLGLKTLLVNCEPNGLSEIGRKNIENLKCLGFDTIVVRPDPVMLNVLIKHDFWNGLNFIKPTEYPLYLSTPIIADKFDVWESDLLMIRYDGEVLVHGFRD